MSMNLTAFIVLLALCLNYVKTCGRGKSTKCPKQCSCPEKIDVHLTIQNKIRPDFFRYQVTIRNTTKAELIRHLEMAANKDSHFKFSSTFYPGMGYFIQSINGVHSNYSYDKSYWEIIDVDNKQLNIGLSSHVPGHNEHIIFNLTFHGDN